MNDAHDDLGDRSIGAPALGEAAASSELADVSDVSDVGDAAEASEGVRTAFAPPSLADDVALTGELEADLAAIEAELAALDHSG